MGRLILNEIEYSGTDGGVELTYAEYLALPEPAKHNGTTYYITDVNDDNNGFQPVIYSEDEHEIGVWIDGKPLYEKTINFGALPNNTSKTVSHNIDNIDKIVSINGIGIGSNSKPLPFVDDAVKTGDILLDASSTNIRIINHYDQSSYNGYITLQYTKTTDTAGSGKWTPQGVPAVHYSTEEKVVGTWIDGSTVYEKVIHFSPEISITTSFASCGVDSTNMDKMIYIYAIHPDGTGYGDVMADPSLSNHTLLGLKASTQHTTEYIIIRYTKSS